MENLGHKIIKYLRIENEPEKVKLTAKALLVEVLRVNNYCNDERAKELVLTEEEKNSYDYRILDLATYWGNDLEVIFTERTGIKDVFDKIFVFIDEEFEK